MADDPMLREMTSDPKSRKVLVTDGMTAVGQALVREFAKSGAELIWVGHAEPWKQHGSGLEAIAALPQVTLVPLDLTDGRSVQALAGEIGGKVDIVVNNAEVHRGFRHLRRGAAPTWPSSRWKSTTSARCGWRRRSDPRWRAAAPTARPTPARG